MLRYLKEKQFNDFLLMYMTQSMYKKHKLQDAFFSLRMVLGLAYVISSPTTKKVEFEVFYCDFFRILCLSLFARSYFVKP